MEVTRFCFHLVIGICIVIVRNDEGEHVCEWKCINWRRQHISKENFATKQQTNKQAKIEYWKYLPSYKTSVENYGVARIQSLASIARVTNVVVDSIVSITACVAPFILHLPALKLENKSVVLPNLSDRK